MTSQQRPNPALPNLPDPTQEDVRSVQGSLEDKYGAVLPQPETLKLTRLIKELDWWRKADQDRDGIAGELAAELDEILGRPGKSDASDSEKKQDAQILSAAIPLQEKTRLVGEIKALVIPYRPVPFDPEVEKKVAALFQAHYGLELDEDQLQQAVQYLYRVLWQEEGLDASLGNYLDALLTDFNIEKPGTILVIRNAFAWMAEHLENN